MTAPKPSRNNAGDTPNIREGASQETIIEGSEELKDECRDLVRGEGGTIDLPTNPGDLSRDVAKRPWMGPVWSKRPNCLSVV